MPGVQETIDYIAICRLQAAYADVVNRRAWPELDDLFLPDAPVRVDTVTNPLIDLVGGRAVGDFIAGAIERFEFFEFVILNTVVDLAVDDDPDRARSRLFMCELRQDAASGRWTNAYGVYHDQYRRTEGRWRFSARDYQSLARTTGRAEVFPFPTSPGSSRS
jgi:hypothetical protein